PFGHRGANHPVRNAITGRISITSQNHGFCVCPDTVPKDVLLTDFNANDNTLEGLKIDRLSAFSVQYHPEAGPGPHDARYLFGEFAQLIDNFHKECSPRA
ncbi:MAG: glutamine amidotransferase-related protein, partial [Candidatus Adiutrix sp.]